MEEERLAHLEKQQKQEAIYRDQIEQANRERFRLEMEIDEMKHVLEAKEAAIKREQELKEEQIRLAQTSVQQHPESFEPGLGRQPPKNRREVHISETLYESLERKLPPPPKKQQKIKVDPAEYERYEEASRFTVQFVNVSAVPGSNVPLPRLFYFTVKFFNMPPFRTDNITFLHSENHLPVAVKLVKEAYFVYNQENIDPLYQFVVDPSLYSNPVGLHRDYIDYLAHKKLIIDVYNAQTHMYMGQLNISLAELLRGKRERAFSAKEYSLIF